MALLEPDENLQFQFGTDGDDLVRLGAGDDAYDGGGGDDELRGGGGDDVLFGGDGDDRLLGQGGDDIFDGGGGDDLMNGGAGADTVLYTANQRAVRIDLATGIASFPNQRAASEALFSIENAATGSGNDLLYGSGAANIFEGGGGHDRFFGAGGNDTFLGGGGDDTFDGGSGSDTVLYDENTRPVRADLAEGVVSFPGQRSPAEAVESIENAVTGSGDDTLIGNRSANRLSAGEGDDSLSGGGGGDRLDGGAGADRLSGGGGDDTLIGGFEADRLDGGSGDDVLVGGGGQDYLNGGAGQDTAVYPFDWWAQYMNNDSPDAVGEESINVDLRADWVRLSGYYESDFVYETIASIENITAGDGNDRIIGDDGANVIKTGAGINTVRGLGGNDIIHGGSDSSESGGEILDGGAGDDVIYSNGCYEFIETRRGDIIAGDEVVLGGRGDDKIYAGYGDLRISGGAGSDEFYFSDSIVYGYIYAGYLGSYSGDTATITDYDRNDGDRIYVDLADPGRFTFVEGRPEQPFEWGISREAEDVVVRFGLANAHDLESDLADALVTTSIRFEDYAGALSEDDFLLV